MSVIIDKYIPPEVSKRALHRKYVCTTCKKSTKIQITPGKLHSLYNCILTNGCTGRLYEDANAVLSNPSELTYTTSAPVVKQQFVRQRKITVLHNYGRLGSVFIDLFVAPHIESEPLTKKYDFVIINQTVNSVTIEMPTSETGVVVVTDNQYASEQSPLVRSVEQVSLLKNSVVTIAIDKFYQTGNVPIDAGGNEIIVTPATKFDITGNKIIPTTGVPIPVTWIHRTLDIMLNTQDLTATQRRQQYNATTGATTITNKLRFYNHVCQSYNTVVAASGAFSALHTIVMGKIYHLYSAVVPSEYTQRGKTMIMSTNSANTPPISIVGFIPYARSDKTTPSDIVSSSIIPLDTISLGDIVADGAQWLVNNPSAILPISTPFLTI